MYGQCHQFPSRANTFELLLLLLVEAGQLEAGL